MPFQSTDQPAMTPSSNAGARSLTFVHAFEVGERKLCAMLVWLCSKCDGVHIWMNSKVLVVGTTFSLARLSQYCNTYFCSINCTCPRWHAGWAMPAQPARRGPAPPGAGAGTRELRAVVPKMHVCMHLLHTRAAPALRAAACTKKKQKKRTEGKN